jgi:hypothetical protein
MAMAAVSAKDKKTRTDHMKMFGQWLKDEKRTQKWASLQLGIYSGYLSNLCTGKQVASKEICVKAGKLMDPLDMRDRWVVVSYDEIEVYRKRERLTKTAMAENLSVMDSTYYRWKRGTSVPTKRRQQEIKDIIEGRMSYTWPGHSTLPLNRPLSPEEEDVVASVVTAWIKSTPPDKLTPIGVTEVTRALVVGFTTYRKRGLSPTTLRSVSIGQTRPS